MVATMIKKYKGKELRTYFVSKVRHAKTKNNEDYTMFTIKDTNKEFYQVIVWENVDIKDGDEIAFEEFLGFEVKTEQFNGKDYLTKLITAKIAPKEKESEKPINLDEFSLDNIDVPFDV